MSHSKCLILAAVWYSGSAILAYMFIMACAKYTFSDAIPFLFGLVIYLSFGTFWLCAAKGEQVAQ